jgi:hypothetical protein
MDSYSLTALRPSGSKTIGTPSLSVWPLSSTQNTIIAPPNCRKEGSTLRFHQAKTRKTLLIHGGVFRMQFASETDGTHELMSCPLDFAPVATCVIAIPI